MQDSTTYYAKQVPDPSFLHSIIPAPALSVTLQLVNVLLLLAAFAIICCFTNHSDIVKKYLFVVALADLGHIYAVYCGMGEEYFWNPNKWNDMTCGNIGMSVFLNINRWATLLGLFGKVGPQSSATKKRT